MADLKRNRFLNFQFSIYYMKSLDRATKSSTYKENTQPCYRNKTKKDLKKQAIGKFTAVSNA